jgi:DNA (cytosine-5)-methyltransferase 1
MNKDKNITVAPFSRIKGTYLTIDEFLKELEEQAYPLPRKQIDFRRKTGVINSHTIRPELKFEKIKGQGSKLLINKTEAINYLLRLKKQSVFINYKDVKSVVESYDEVMLKPARAAMRANRNFTGKIEDEVRGKLVEWGLAKYVYEQIGLELVIDFALITVTTRKRDEGDFVRCLINGKERAIPDELKLSVKSTSGNLLAVPETETTWEGEWFILAKLHIEDKFLYEAIKAGLGLLQLDFEKILGWFEIRGFVSKRDFINPEISYKGVNLPSPFNMPGDFGRDNYIMLPNQLNQNPEDFLTLLKEIKKAVTT